ncbi:MAG TPA: NrfD/PsrC family molybdoenzyme membrane anchor subunit [Kofleriaceae bacterium]|nr:NrfD/PsrC family molybdoenzyme membrane anchor subunit [Kofleriaceae bacterium]
MGPAHGTQPLPRTSVAWLAAILLAAGAVGFGAFCFLEQLRSGFIVTGLRNPGQGGGAWGLYIAFDVFFVGVSFAGITVAALCRLFEIEALRPVTRLAELLTITALLAGAAAVLSDLGRPLEGLLNLPRYANPRSPFFGTFTLVVAGYLFSSLVYFFLAARADAAATSRTARHGRWLYRLWASGWTDGPAERERHHRVSFWLAIGILPLLVTAHSTLGFIFGIQSGRPGWYSALQAPAFVVMAGVSGTGMVILATLAVRRLFRLEERIPDASIGWLGNFLWVLALVYLYLMVVEELTATYAAPAADRHLAHQVVTGHFAPLFWTTVVCLVLAFAIPFSLYLRRRTSVAAVGVAALLANVAAVGKRILIVVPSQTHGALLPVDPPGAYAPTWVELGLVGGMFGIVALAVLAFVRVFPIVPTAHGAPPRAAARSSGDWLRAAAALLTIAIAMAVIAVGLSDSFRMWSGEDIDPRIPYSPALFAGGVILLFSSAVVYETFPRRRRARAARRAARVPHPPPTSAPRLRARSARVTARPWLRSPRSRNPGARHE